MSEERRRCVHSGLACGCSAEVELLREELNRGSAARLRLQAEVEALRSLNRRQAWRLDKIRELADASCRESGEKGEK